MSVQSCQVFAQPVVFQDVDDADCREHIVAALKELTSISDSVFRRLEIRIEDQRTRLAGLRSRISISRTKIDKLATYSSKPTKMHAHPKYPVPEGEREYRSVFEGLPYAAAPKDVEMTPDMRIADETADVHRDAIHRDMLNFFASVTAEAEFKAEAAERGLGPIPLHVRSSANILLFNSTENPYKQYNELDNLLQGQERERQQESSAAGLAAAPKTLIDGDDQVDVDGMDMSFKPEVQEMEAFALPDTLQLPNVADLQFGSAADVDQYMAPIAPSYFLKESYLSLPAPEAIPAATKATPPPPPPAPAASAAGSTPPPPPPNPTTAPPPPPAPTASVPPAPAPASAPAPAPVESRELTLEEVSPAAATGMNALLAAIRNPGNKKKLGKAGEDGAKPRPAPAPAPRKPLNPMEEMKLKFANRRKHLQPEAKKPAASEEDDDSDGGESLLAITAAPHKPTSSASGPKSAVAAPPKPPAAANPSDSGSSSGSSSDDDESDDAVSVARSMLRKAPASRPANPAPMVRRQSGLYDLENVGGAVGKLMQPANPIAEGGNDGSSSSGNDWSDSD